MHIATITGENPLGLGPGEYLAENVNAGTMLANGWATELRRPDTRQWKRFDPERDWSGKRILFVRPGGFGDLLFLTPTMAEIKRRWPQAEIYVACFERFRGALENNPDVRGFVSYPVPIETGYRKADTGKEELGWEDFEGQVWLEGAIEGDPIAEKMHAVDLIAAKCGLGDLKEKEMRYFVSVEERNAAHKEFPREFEQARIGIQVSASGRCRIYPHILEVAKLLWREGHEVFLFGAPGEVKTDEPEGLVNLMALNKTFRESCAILETCDVLVAPDSALVHVAGALMRDTGYEMRDGEGIRGSRTSYLASPIPAVGLYGPFPWQLRTKYARETFALQGVGACSPCFHHARPGTREFPEHGPCAQTGRCEVLAAITPARVVREVARKLENVNRDRRIVNREEVIV